MKKYSPLVFLLLAGAAGFAAYSYTRQPQPTLTTGRVDGGPDPVFSDLALDGRPAPEAPSRVPDEKRLDRAIEQLRPAMKDLADRLDDGTARLVLWAAKRLDWAQLDALPETSAALFRRDPDQERGRKICLRGVLKEIRAEQNIAHRLIEDTALPLLPVGAARSSPPIGFGGVDAGSAGDGGASTLFGGDDRQWAVPRGKAYFAILVPPQPKEEPGVVRPGKEDNVAELEAIAVRSGGNLVDGSTARFCGVLTGVTSMATTSSDHRLRHRAVGMFDLPENRGLGEAQPAVSAAPTASIAPASSAAGGAAP